MSYDLALKHLQEKPGKTLAIGSYKNAVGECCALGYLCPSLPSMEIEAIKIFNEKTGKRAIALDIETIVKYCPGAKRELDALDLTVEEAQTLQQYNDTGFEHNSERYRYVIDFLKKETNQ